MKEFTEEEAERHPSVLIHKAKLEATTQEASRREGVEERQKGRSTRGIAQTGIKAAEAVGVSVLKGLGHIARIKGVRPQDEWVNPKTIPMYLPQNSQVSPLGYKPTTHELFFGGRDKLSDIHGTQAREKLGEFGDYQMVLRERLYGNLGGKAPNGTEEVYSAYQRGANVDELEVETGLQPQQISHCLRYLMEKGKIPKEYRG